MKLIYVKAAAGMKMPREGNPRSYITDSEPVQVEGSHYYRKAIADGDLVELTEKEWDAHQAALEATATAASEAAKDAPRGGKK
jgi:hypothetical protein